jgi:hypothetical protein
MASSGFEPAILGSRGQHAKVAVRSKAPLHIGDRVAGDWSANDRENMASNEGFRRSDCPSKASRRQNSW